MYTYVSLISQMLGMMCGKMYSVGSWNCCCWLYTDALETIAPARSLLCHKYIAVPWWLFPSLCIHIYIYICVQILHFVLKTLLHHKRLENVGPYPPKTPDTFKETYKNMKTYEKRWGGTTLLGPCGWRGWVQCVQLKTIMSQGVGCHWWLLWSCPL